jgi:hypothetical protein
MRLAIVLAVVLVASVAFAAPTAVGPASNGTGTFEYESTREIKWEQLPLIGGTAVASQYDPVYPFYAESADDFLCEDGTPITAVEWWGQYWNPGYVISPDYFVIRFYDDVPAPPFSHPGNLLYEEYCYDYNEEYDAYYDQYHYFQDLIVPFEQQPGLIYWVSFQPVLVFSGGSQWGWCECDPFYYWQDCGVMDFALLGIPRWTPFTDPLVFGEHRELAFVLHGPASPVESSSWGEIKALFR